MTKIEFAIVGWKPIPECPGYFVTADGAVRGPSGKVLRLNYRKSGHAYIALRGSGLRKNLNVHRAVWQAYRGGIPHGLEIRHLNGNPADNRLCNLAIGDRYAQRADDRRNSVTRRPLDLVLDENKVAAIRKLFGRTSSRIVAKTFHVSHTTIQKVWRGERWVQR